MLLDLAVLAVQVVSVRLFLQLAARAAQAAARIPITVALAELAQAVHFRHPGALAVLLPRPPGGAQAAGAARARSLAAAALEAGHLPAILAQAVVAASIWVMAVHL